MKQHQHSVQNHKSHILSLLSHAMGVLFFVFIFTFFTIDVAFAEAIQSFWQTTPTEATEKQDSEVLSLLVVPMLLLGLPLLIIKLLILSSGAKIPVWKSFLPLFIGFLLSLYAVALLSQMGLPFLFKSYWVETLAAAGALFLVCYGIDSLLLIATQRKAATERIAFSAAIGNVMLCVAIIGVNVSFTHLSVDARNNVAAVGNMLAIPLLELPTTDWSHIVDDSHSFYTTPSE